MEEGSRTYAEIEDASARLASSLATRGVARGDRVALMMQNSIDQVLVWFALNRLGIVHAPLNTALKGLPLEHAIDLLRPALLIVDAEFLDVVRSACPASVSIPMVVRQSDCSQGLVDLRDLLQESDRAAPVDVDPLSTATLLFTSGTTGRSKACELSNTYLVRQGQIQAKYLGIRPDDTLFSPFPLFHIDAATLTVIAALSVGASAAVGRRFSVSKFWDEVRDHGVTVFNFMGATLSMLWKQEPSVRDRDHLVRLAWGVPIPDWQPQFEDRFGFPIYQVYGLTDAGIPVYDPLDGSRRPGSAGRVIDEYEVQICDPWLTTVAPGVVGEILVRGREPGLVMNGYFAMPQATEAVFVDGWLQTGDSGSLDEAGFLTFLGRLSDSIRRRGENISAFEVEEILRSHEAVSDVAVIGVPSNLTEEEVKACVVLKAGRQLEPNELVQFCRTVAPRHMVPRFIEVVDTLPKTPTEKTEKFRLKTIGVNDATWDSELGAYSSAADPSRASG